MGFHSRVQGRGQLKIVSKKGARMQKIVRTTILMAIIVSFGCASMGEKERTGTAAGAASGAVLGGVVGAMTGKKNQREKVLVGATAGAAIGGLAGNRIGAYMDKQEADLRAAMAATVAANNATIERNNEQMLTATFKGDVFFGFDSATLKPGAYAEMDRVAGVLNQYPQTLIRIEGHTDPIGNEQYNQQLSERRADAVRNALLQRGVDPSRVSTAGMGECCPISSDNAANRRVSMQLTGRA
jgi:outer membrane protein OmpA-like peptidoglycan-associated protein